MALMTKDDVGRWPFGDEYYRNSKDCIDHNKFRAPVDMEEGDIVEPCFILVENEIGHPVLQRVIKRILRRKNGTGPYGVVWSREFGLGEMP